MNFIFQNKQLIDNSNIGRLYVFTLNQHNRLILESYKNADIQKLPKNDKFSRKNILGAKFQMNVKVIFP